jgi:hypothetical protein
MEFYKVVAKCGHVGKGKYYEGAFYVRAEDGRSAAALVRQKPRVKHDHKDAILNVAKIDYKAFKAGQAEYRENPYFKCHNTQEQRMCFADILDNIKYDNHSESKIKKSIDRLAKLEIIRKLERKMNKYGEKNYYNTTYKGN